MKAMFFMLLAAILGFSSGWFANSHLSNLIHNVKSDHWKWSALAGLECLLVILVAAFLE
jgi:hypothetical protein